MSDGGGSLRSVALAAVALLVAACGTGSESTSAAPTATPAALQAVLVGSEFLVGDQRFPVGILDHNTPVNDATVHVRAFLVIGNNTALVNGAATPPFRV